MYFDPNPQTEKREFPTLDEAREFALALGAEESRTRTPHPNGPRKTLWIVIYGSGTSYNIDKYGCFP